MATGMNHQGIMWSTKLKVPILDHVNTHTYVHIMSRLHDSSAVGVTNARIIIAGEINAIG